MDSCDSTGRSSIKLNGDWEALRGLARRFALKRDKCGSRSLVVGKRWRKFSSFVESFRESTVVEISGLFVIFLKPL